MASRSYSKSVGQTEFSIVEAANAPGAGDMELRVDLTKLHGGNIEVIAFLKELMNYFAGKGSRIG